MKMNVIPNEEFIENLEYATNWYHELRNGLFVINACDSHFSPMSRVGNFTEWFHQQCKNRRRPDPIRMWGELRLLIEASPYVNIEKLEFVGVCPEYIRDMGDALTTLCEIFREVEVNRGPAKVNYRRNTPIELGPYTQALGKFPVG